MKATLILCAALAVSALMAVAEPARPTLPVEDRTNGQQTVAALDKLVPTVLACAARIESLLGRPVCEATIVGEDGYVLTKASEVPEMEKVRVKFANAARQSFARSGVRCDLTSCWRRPSA